MSGKISGWFVADVRPIQQVRPQALLGREGIPAAQDNMARLLSDCNLPRGPRSANRGEFIPMLQEIKEKQFP